MYATHRVVSYQYFYDLGFCVAFFSDEDIGVFTTTFSLK